MCIQFAYKQPQKISTHSLTSATQRSIFGYAKPFPMKYAVLLLALIFAGCTDGGYETFTIAGEIMQVDKEDFPSDMSWNDAMAACQNLGNGWRLPNKDELAAMYNQLHTKGKGNFRTDNFYWSSSERNPERAWAFYFEDGRADPISLNKYSALRVRAVRALP